MQQLQISVLVLLLAVRERATVAEEWYHHNLLHFPHVNPIGRLHIHTSNIPMKYMYTHRINANTMNSYNLVFLKQNIHHIILKNIQNHAHTYIRIVHIKGRFRIVQVD